MRLARAPLFLAERLVSQGGGLLFTAILARDAAPDEAAAFFTAYAVAAIFQPMLSGAVQPLTARRWRAGGLAAVVRIWAALQIAALCIVGPLIWLADGWMAAFILLHAALAPGLLMATPLAAEDRRGALVLILIAAASVGIALRVGAYLATGDLAIAAIFFSFEPVGGGVAFWLASRRLSPSASAAPPPTPAFAKEALLMAAAMGLTTLFWRSPVLLADAFLAAGDVIALGLAMQVVMGLCIPANALSQSLFGPLTKGDRAAPGIILWIALIAGVGAPALLVVAGEAILTALYGPLGKDAVGLATMLAPMAGLAALWRLAQIMGGLHGLAGELALTRCAALCGQAALLIMLMIAPLADLIAVVTPVSMVIAAVIAPLLTPGLAGLAKRAALSARRAALRSTGRRQAIRLMFS